MVAAPEALARQTIDAAMVAAGWVVQEPLDSDLATLERVRITLPPDDQIEMIASYMGSELSVIKELQRVIDTNDGRAFRLRQSIIRRAFAVELVPQDPDDEPAILLMERIAAERTLSAQKQGKSRGTRKEGQHALW